MFGLFSISIATFLLGVSLVIVMRHLSATLQLVDRPDSERKRHKGTIPLCGGIAIFATFTIASFTTGQMDDLSGNFWLGLLVILLLGVVDDRWPLLAAGRLVVQLIIATILIKGTNIDTLSIGALFPQTSGALLPLYFVLGILFVTGLINSWNMLDGVDGLAGGSALIALFWLMVIASSTGVVELLHPLTTLSMCLCAFLAFNLRNPWRQRASIFLGDAGSTALGATIAFVIMLLATEAKAATFPALLWVVIVPVADTLSLISRRLLAHRNPMSADRWHLHHLLLDHGLSPAAATNTLMVISALCGGIGYLGIRMSVPGEIMALALLLPLSLHTAFVMAATGYLSKLQRRYARKAPTSLRPADNRRSGSRSSLLTSLNADFER